MTYTYALISRCKFLWPWSWPVCMLVPFGALAAVQLLPAGFLRVAVATPILLTVTGSLTLGAFFSERHRPRGAVFVCYAALLSVVWSAFASLALYVFNVLITADSMLWCLLIISSQLALVAEARLLLGRLGGGARVASELETPHEDLRHAEVVDPEAPATGIGAGLSVISAALAGLFLLGGAAYAWDRIPYPAPAGYTWMAWTGPPIKGVIAVGSGGTELPFKIVNRQPDTTVFRLEAVWLDTPSRLVAKPRTFSIRPDQTVRSTLFVPPLPNGCTYRIVVSLTAPLQVDPLTKTPSRWSLNADVHDPSKSLKTCRE
jgi:hypothetical protein